MVGIFALLLLLLRSCNSSQESYSGNDKISVTLYANTLHEVDGISTVPTVFGITAYNGVSDFAVQSGSRFLAAHNIDTVGFGTTINSLLPTGDFTLSTSSLDDWFSTGNAYNKYRNTPDYTTLRSRGIRKGGAKPFLFLRNVHGKCTPYCQKVNCWSEGGTPKSRTSGGQYAAGFEWWTTLITGYLKQALKTDPNIDTIHIWNEPDKTFWKDGKNGTYYSNMYLTMAKAIKSIWPNIKIGGPVSSSLSTGLFRTRKRTLLLWYTYIKPLIDSAVPLDLLDFIDFHAFDGDTSPEVLLNAMETTVSYSLVTHKVFVPIAITESSIYSNSYQQISKQNYFLNRTLPLMVSTFVLLRSPDKVIHRLLFDYKGTSKCERCTFARQSPEALMYQLLGKLVNGSRLYLEVDGGQYMTSNCICYTSKSLGGQPIIGEAAVINKNVTFALLNTCNCPITIKLSLVGLTNSVVKSSWAAIQDYNGVTDVTPLSWLSSIQSFNLPSHSLYVSTHEFSTRYYATSSSFSSPSTSSSTSSPSTSSSSNPFLFYTTKEPNNQLVTRPSSTNSNSKHHHKMRSNGKRFPIRLDYVQQIITSYPSKTQYIMMAIPVPVPCNYMFSIDYDVQNALNYHPVQVKLKLGFIGAPGSVNWSVTWKCSRYYNSVESKNWLQIISPGQYYEDTLTCVPRLRSNGYVRLHFKASNKCQSLSESVSSSSSVGYFAFSSLMYMSQVPLS